MSKKIIKINILLLLLLFQGNLQAENYNSRKSKTDDQTIIMIDPGHGGENMGAEGYYGIYEKHITLILSQKLLKLLSYDDRFKVMMTRDEDVFVGLQDRISLANSKQAALFISIHCNSVEDEKVKGFEVFFITADGFKNIENTVEDEGFISDTSKLYTREVDKIVNDIKLNHNINESEILAEKILSKFSQHLKNTENRGIKQALYTVIENSTMPAVIIEPGFLSNPEEGLLLLHEEYQDQIVHAIYEGILSYLNK